VYVEQLMITASPDDLSEVSFTTSLQPPAQTNEQSMSVVVHVVAVLHLLGRQLINQSISQSIVGLYSV